ncbi:MAG: hypothetical protein ACKPKO_18030, partial [Candidatus Fonsibacter sp.]
MDYARVAEKNGTERSSERELRLDVDVAGLSDDTKWADINGDPVVVQPAVHCGKGLHGDVEEQP